MSVEMLVATYVLLMMMVLPESPKINSTCPRIQKINLDHLAASVVDIYHHSLILFRRSIYAERCLCNCKPTVHQYVKCHLQTMLYKFKRNSHTGNPESAPRPAPAATRRKSAEAIARAASWYWHLYFLASASVLDIKTPFTTP